MPARRDTDGPGFEKEICEMRCKWLQDEKEASGDKKQKSKTQSVQIRQPLEREHGKVAANHGTSDKGDARRVVAVYRVVEIRQCVIRRCLVDPGGDFGEEHVASRV